MPFLLLGEGGVDVCVTCEGLSLVSCALRLCMCVSRFFFVADGEIAGGAEERVRTAKDADEAARR